MGSAVAALQLSIKTDGPSVNYGINVRGKPFESFKVNVRVKLELKA